MYERILIVDDSATSRMIIKRCLEIAGFQDSSFLEAEDGIDALSILEENDADLIVTDLNMPKMDGTNFIKKLKIKENCKEIPIIVISSTVSESSIEEYTEMGVKGVISKPVSPEKISAALGESNVS